MIVPDDPKEVREVISLHRLKDAINESSKECRAIKEERRRLSRQMSLLDERARKLQARNRDLTTFAAWLRGYNKFMIESVRIKLTKEFWTSAIDKLADIAIRELARQQGEQEPTK